MRHFKPFFLLLLCSLAILLAAGCGNAKAAKDEQAAFEAFTYDIFVEEVQCDSLTLNYTLTHPEAYSIASPEPTLGELSRKSLAEDTAITENYLARMGEFNYKNLTADQKLTYDILKAYLEPAKDAERYYLYQEYLDSTVGIQAQLPILLAEYNFNKKEDFVHYLSLLPQVMVYFKDIISFEKEKSEAGLFMSDAAADAIIKQCRGFVEKPSENYLISIFNDEVDQFAGLTEEEKSTFKKENKEAVLNSVIPAYQSLIDALASLKGTGKNDGGLCNLPDGKAFYEYLVAAETGSSKSIRQIDATLDSAMNTAVMDMSGILIQDEDIYEAVTDVTYPMTDPEEIITYLTKAIQNEFPPLENINCTIKYVDKSLEDYLSPAFYLTPPIDDFTKNSVYINGGDSYDLSSIFTTIAHEGYPGHLYQNVYFRQNNPSPIRSLLGFSGYAEGWATYVEFYSYSLTGLDTNTASFLMNNNLLSLCLYGKMDVGIHYYGWGKEKVTEYLGSYGLADEEDINTIYNTIVSQPGNYLKYILGALEFKELRRAAEKALGDRFSPVEYHKFILETGPCQFSVLKDQVERFIKAQK